MPLALVFGRTGQLARALATAPLPEGWRLESLGREDVDLRAPKAIARTIESRRPDVVINAAAYTAVDKAESEPAEAAAINTFAPQTMAAAAEALGAAFVTVSTDYVFDGSKAGPWIEDDPIRPLNVYGETKAAGEAAAMAANRRTAIVRTSWVISPHGRNFVTGMLALARERDTLDIVDDQTGRPTSARDLAEALLVVAEKAVGPSPRFGVFHFSNGGEPVTWKGFAEAVFDLASPRLVRRPEIRATTTAARAAPAKRPANSVLALGRIIAAFDLTPRDWRVALAEIVDEIAAGTTSPD
jgi:dTDP-4-dehydrorhamnose reductase